VNSSGNACDVSYTVNWGDGTINGDTANGSPVHTYSADGTYVITVDESVTNGGCGGPPQASYIFTFGN
jgi:PKD repeat protein